MPTRRTLKRVALIGLGLLLAVGIGVLLLGRTAAKSIAASQLSSAIGLPVVVDRLDLGGGSTGIGFRVLEPAGSDGKRAEILDVRSATADVSVAALAAGTMPNSLNIDGLTLTLAVSPDGKLLTKLPSGSGSSGATPTLPRITADNVTVAIAQSGRPPFQFSGIHLTATPTDGKIVLAGDAKDPAWGAWKLAGNLDPNTVTGSVVLSTDSTHLTPELLQSIPFVPASVWQQVAVAGETAAVLTFNLGADSAFTFDIELTPKNARVGVTAIAATFEELNGTVRVRGPQVLLEKCTAKLADGTVKLGGDLNFGPEPAQLAFDIGVEKVDVHKLPAEWGLPAQIGGKLRGTAKLTLAIHEDGRVLPGGGGEAKLDDATVAGLPAEVSLRLVSDGKRYRFQTMPKDGAARPVVGPPLRAARRVEAQAPEPPAEDPNKPTTFEANVALRDVDIAELLKKLEVAIPYKVAGKVTVKASVAIPLAKAANRQEYRIRGRVTSPALTLEGLEVANFAADIVYLRGQATLTSFSGNIPAAGDKPGDPPRKITGSATARIEPELGHLSVVLDLDRVPMDQLHKAIPGGSTADLRGPVSGKLLFSSPINGISEPKNWTGRATLKGPEVEIVGRPMTDVVLGFSVEKGNATLTDSSAKLAGIPLAASGEIGLEKPFKFSAKLNTTAADVADLRKLVPDLKIPVEVAGKIAVAAKATGTVEPLAIVSDGTLKASDLDLGTSTGNAVAFAWAVDNERAKITDLDAKLFGGTVKGFADIPLDSAKAGSAVLEFDNLDAAPASRLVPDMPVRITGRISGKLDVKLPAAEPGKARIPVGNLDLTAPRLTVQGIPAERLSGSLKAADGGVEYDLKGRALGGSFDVNGRYPPRAKPNVGPAREGSLNLRGVNLGRLSIALGLGERLRGTADLFFNFADDLSSGEGRFRVRRLAWGDFVLASELTSRILLRDQRLSLSDFGGTIAGGFPNGKIIVNLESLRSGWFRMSINRAQLPILAAPLGFELQDASGTVSAVITGRLGRRSTGQGTLVISQGGIGGVPLTSLRVPIAWTVGAYGKYGQVSAREAAGALGGGQITGNAMYSWGAAGQAEAKFRFTNLRIGSIVPSLNGDSRFGAASITGTASLNGRNVQSINDLSGLLNANLAQASLGHVPVLRVIKPFIPAIGLFTPFEKGDVRARLNRGIVRVDRLALRNPGARVFVEGTVTLAGRLDLGVLVQTGPGAVEDQLFRLFANRIPYAGPLIPIAVVRDITEFVSNRAIRLIVTGTVNHPVARLNTAALLTDEAIRFLVNKYSPVPVGDLPSTR